jgi:hypothetical protein
MVIYASIVLGRASKLQPVFFNNCRYLFTEWEDPEFGGRASAVHSGLVNALAAAGRIGEAVWLAIRRQTDMMSQLAYITKELKVGRGVTAVV